MTKPTSPQNAPYKVKVEKDKTYSWCSCGLSKKQPFCDGSHVGTDFIPLKYSAEKNETKFFCTCKKTKNKPHLIKSNIF